MIVVGILQQAMTASIAPVARPYLKPLELPCLGIACARSMIAYCGLCVSAQTRIAIGSTRSFAATPVTGMSIASTSCAHAVTVRDDDRQAAVDTGIGAEDCPAFHRQPDEGRREIDAREGCPLQPTRSVEPSRQPDQRDFISGELQRVVSEVVANVVWRVADDVFDAAITLKKIGNAIEVVISPISNIGSDGRIPSAAWRLWNSPGAAAGVPNGADERFDGEQLLAAPFRFKVEPVRNLTPDVRRQRSPVIASEHI